MDPSRRGQTAIADIHPGPSLLFRVACSARIGTGHLMRCLAIAEACRAQGATAVFALDGDIGPLVARITRAGIGVVQLDQDADGSRTAALVGELDADALVIDGYRFDARFRRQVAAAGAPVLALDDGQCTHPLHADWVLNTSPLARPGDYAGIAPQAHLLLGPAYVTLRGEFTRPAPPLRLDAPRVLVSFGGSDPARMTGAVVDALCRALPEAVALDVVVGGACAHPVDPPGPACNRAVRWHHDVQDMAALMRGSALAISAAGSTLWELAYLGIPSIAVVVADNQAAVLDPAMRGWFNGVDARHQRNHAVSAAVDRACALLADPGARARITAALRAVGVGSRAQAVCELLLQATRARL